MSYQTEYSACLEYGTYPDGPGYTDTCPPPSTVTSVYYSAPPGYTSSSAYTPPPYTTSYTPQEYSSAYTPNPYTSINSPRPYTSSCSSFTSVYTPQPYTSSPVGYTSVDTPPTYTPIYTPPVSVYTPSVYTPSYTPVTDYTSVPYITVDLPNYTSSYVPPVYTPMPYESSYVPDPEEPTYTPPNPYESPNPTVIIVDPPQQTYPARNFTPVVGPPGVELRLPIDELQADHPDVWNMFCLAMESMMAVEESLDLSYYQISGIHGLPHIPWQYPINPATQDPTRGYCTHSSALFSTWHRPYLTLLEVCAHPFLWFWRGHITHSI